MYVGALFRQLHSVGKGLGADGFGSKPSRSTKNQVFIHPGGHHPPYPRPGRLCTDAIRTALPLPRAVGAPARAPARRPAASGGARVRAPRSLAGARRAGKREALAGGRRSLPPPLLPCPLRQRPQHALLLKRQAGRPASPPTAVFVLPCKR